MLFVVCLLGSVVSYSRVGIPTEASGRLPQQRHLAMHMSFSQQASTLQIHLASEATGNVLHPKVAQ